MSSGVRHLLACTMVGLVSVVLSACATSTPGAAPNQASSTQTPSPVPLPSVTLPALRAEASPRELDLSTLRGPAVLNFWATWCALCRGEMPVLQQYHQQHGDAVKIIGIDFMDPQAEAAVSLADKAGVTYPLFADVEGRLSARPPFPNLRGLPYLALIDGEGRLVHGEFGALDDVDQLEQLLAEHLGVRR